MDKVQAVHWLDSQAEQLFKLSDQIWDNPELGYEEQVSARLLEEELERQGFQVTRGLAGIPTAFCGQFGSGRPYIGLLGEFDALPGLNQKAGAVEPVPDGTVTSNGHGCGHNLLGVGSLGAALAVKKYLEETSCSGTIFYYGCPAEENGSAKAFLARDGVFDDLDAALSWHPNALTGVWAFSSLANVRSVYRFHGISAHAATSPHLGRSALDALELMNMGVQFLREHIIPEARVHYAITNTGGDAPNVVQAEAEVVYLIRAPRNDQVKEILERVDQIARGAAMMSGVTVDCEVEKACSNILVNHTLEQLLSANLKAIPLPQYTQDELDYGKALQDTMPNRTTLAQRFGVMMGEQGRKLGAKYDQQSIYSFVLPYHPSEKPVSGSTDVGDVSWVCPTSQIVVTTCAGGTPEHTWQMVAQGKSGPAHKGLLYAAKVLGTTAIDLLEHPDQVQAAKQEHQERIGQSGYQPLLPPDRRPF